MSRIAYFCGNILSYKFGLRKLNSFFHVWWWRTEAKRAIVFTYFLTITLLFTDSLAKQVKKVFTITIKLSNGNKLFNPRPCCEISKWTIPYSVGLHIAPALIIFFLFILVMLYQYQYIIFNLLLFQPLQDWMFSWQTQLQGKWSQGWIFLPRSRHSHQWSPKTGMVTILCCKDCILFNFGLHLYISGSAELNNWCKTRQIENYLNNVVKI